MNDRAHRIAVAISDMAELWSDPDHPTRAMAVEQTLTLKNRFTVESTAFAINQQMSLLSLEALTDWIGGEVVGTSRTIGVINPGNIPAAGLQDLLAVLLTGHAYCGVLSRRSPFILPAFVRDVQEHVDVSARFVSLEEMLAEADAVVASGSNETRGIVHKRCIDAGVAGSRLLLRGHGYGVAVVMGVESSSDWEGLAEDILLHEGLGCRNVALVWAPRGASPDAFMEAAAHFRATFRAHPATAATLKMRTAMLKAVQMPCTYLDDYSILVSRGGAEVQPPGHVRWVEYDDFDEVERWIGDHVDDIEVVVGANPHRFSVPGISAVPPGNAQRPPLDWRPGGVDTRVFLRTLD